jgi:uncharacterized SAM-binding protein YcdF (DUF218 family)
MLIALYAGATPLVSIALLHILDARVPPIVDAASAGAIVVLGGDIRHADDDGTAEGLGPLSEERVQEAAALYRAHSLPVAVSGRTIGGSDASIARLMQQALTRDYDVPVTWVEERSGNTFENAADVAPLLRAAGITKVFVVTQPWHMPRALWCFRRLGLDPVPVPTPPPMFLDPVARNFLPDTGGLQDTYYAFHELIGIVYYRLHYG